MSDDDLAEDDCIGIEEQAANLILELWAEVERQARHVKELREKIDAEKSCACSFDAPGDVCAAHSPALMQARAEVERLTRERDEERSKETDYGEGFEEGWAAAQKQAAAELGRLRKEAWIGAALMLSGLAMILGLGLSLAWSYLP